jgi:hypothetical protein
MTMKYIFVPFRQEELEEVTEDIRKSHETDDKKAENCNSVIDAMAQNWHKIYGYEGKYNPKYSIYIFSGPGSLAGPGPDDPIYILGHGSAGHQNIYPSSTSTSTSYGVCPAELCTRLQAAGVPYGHVNFKLYACCGGMSGSDGNPSFAKIFYPQLLNIYPKAILHSYPYAIKNPTPASGWFSGWFGKPHRFQTNGTTRVKAGRIEYTPACMTPRHANKCDHACQGEKVCPLPFL